MTSPKQYSAWFVFALITSLSCQKEIIREQVGEVNYALEFDGATTVVEIPMTRVQQPAQLTVEVMIWIAAPSRGSVPIISHSDLDQWNQAEGFSVKYEDNHLYWTLASSTRAGESFSAQITLRPMTWYHISCTFDGNTGRLFLDGKLLAEGTRQPFIDYGDRGISLGKGRHALFGGDLHFVGQMDEIRIWNYAQTQSEILANLGHPLAGNEQGLVGYWNFDSRTDYLDPAEDRSSSLNHGQVAGNIRLVRSGAFSQQ